MNSYLGLLSQFRAWRFFHRTMIPRLHPSWYSYVYIASRAGRMKVVAITRLKRHNPHAANRDVATALHEEEGDTADGDDGPHDFQCSHLGLECNA